MDDSWVTVSDYEWSWSIYEHLCKCLTQLKLIVANEYAAMFKKNMYLLLAMATCCFHVVSTQLFGGFKSCLHERGKQMMDHRRGGPKNLVVNMLFAILEGNCPLCHPKRTALIQSSVTWFWQTNRITWIFQMLHSHAGGSLLPKSLWEALLRALQASTGPAPAMACAMILETLKKQTISVGAKNWHMFNLTGNRL